MRLGLIATLVVTVAAAPTVAEARPFTIEARGSDRTFGKVLAIGDFRPERDPTLGAAMGVFGQPASIRGGGGGSSCKVAWPDVGVRILFVNLGGGSACDPRYGKSQEARVAGVDDWRTARGLHVGDRVRKLRRLYPGARRHRRAFWLVTGVSLYGPRKQRYPVLAASVRDGRVASFKLEIGAAGE
jgi:hypothetical protein